MSTQAENPASSSSLPEVPEYFANLTAQSVGQSADAQLDEPPQPPRNAYPSPANPVKATESYTRTIPRYRLYVTATRNNTLITFTRPNGNPIATITGGTAGFKGAKKSSYEAGYTCATKAFGLIKQVKEEDNKMDLELFLSGFGQGRDAVYRALMSEEGSWVKDMIVRLTDKTPIKIGGTRSKKRARR